MLNSNVDEFSRIFDLPDGRARLLRIREGHAAPPICIKCRHLYDFFQFLARFHHKDSNEFSLDFRLW